LDRTGGPPEYKGLQGLKKACGKGAARRQFIGEETNPLFEKGKELSGEPTAFLTRGGKR